MRKKLFFLFFICILSIVIIYIHNISTKINDTNRVSHIYEEKSFNYKNPVVPDGFKKIETDNASWKATENGDILGWNNGLVIEDDKGNQFVWVPVNVLNIEYSDYYQIDDYKYTNENLNDTIRKYQGFYVSRYEAGISINTKKFDTISTETNNIIDIPVSKKNSIPWNYICENNAAESASKMYTKYNVQSRLIDLKQAILINEWLNSCGYDVYNSSREWGNYSNSTFKFSGYYSTDNGEHYNYGMNETKSQCTIISTGSSEKNKANNIYDWAGNLWELTSTKLEGTDYFYSYGGYYGMSGNIGGAGTINAYDGQESCKTGFRIVLDIP